MAYSLNLPSNFKLTSPKTWFRTAKSDGLIVILNPRHIYILPTRFGWLYLILIISLLTGSINYAISLGFAMTFLLTGLGLICMLHTWRNLANLKLSARPAKPIFSGEKATFELTAFEENNFDRFSISASFTNEIANVENIKALGQTSFKLTLPSNKRGWLKMPIITFTTEFPLSLFHVWAYAEIDCQCLIYPNPNIQSIPIPNIDNESNAGKFKSQIGDDDFAGHRSYQFGDSPKRVDWKASSREQGLLIKQFHGEASSTLWLDFNKTTASNLELRISQVTRWVVDCNELNLKYGLRLPHLSINPNNGSAHYHECLTALALM